MPTYDFECIHCGHQFSELVAYGRRKEVPCPKCSKTEAKVRLTGFFIGKSSNKSECGAGACPGSGPGICRGAAACGCSGAR